MGSSRKRDDLNSQQSAPRSHLYEFLQDPQNRVEYAWGALENDASNLLCEAFNGSTPKLSQAEFGRRIGVSRARANQILDGEAKNLTIGVLGRAAGALGLRWKLSLHDLFSGEERYSYVVGPVDPSCAFDHPQKFSYLQGGEQTSGGGEWKLAEAQMEPHVDDFVSVRTRVSHGNNRYVIDQTVKIAP